MRYPIIKKIIKAPRIFQPLVCLCFMLQIFLVGMREAERQEMPMRTSSNEIVFKSIKGDKRLIVIPLAGDYVILFN